MSAESVVLVGAGAVLIVTVVSGRLDRLWLTEPLVASVLGVAAGTWLFTPVDLESPGILTLLEVTLALVLFTDASRINVRRLREGYSWPLRMLLLGMPLAIALGAGVSGWYLGLPLGAALLLGTILAPTDAALAEPVLHSNDVPPRVRQALNVEAGLNDGLAVPVLLIAVGLIEAEEGTSALGAIGLVVTQLGIGVVGGIVLGWVGARIIDKGTKVGWINPLHQRIAAVALAVAGFAAVQLLGGSGFVATFIAGGLMSHLLGGRCEYLYDFAEAEGHTLVLVAFFAFGTGPAAALIANGVQVESVVIAVVSLVLIRPAAIALSLIGQKLMPRTVLFLGWFGPRGLATIVFVLVAIEELEMGDPLIESTVTLVVMISIVAHGLTAVPMSKWLGGMKVDDEMPEMGEAFDYPMRRA